MITEYVLKFFAALGSFVVGLFPTIALPSWVATVTDFIRNGVGAVGAFGNMLPVTAVRLSFLFLLACLGAALAIRLARIALSTFTGGGGSAA